jgi:hypothetical protein
VTRSARESLEQRIDLQARRQVSFECGDRFAVFAQQLIAAPQPDHLWRRPAQSREFCKICIECNKRLTIGAGELPENAVICLGQSEQASMTGVWKEISQLLAELEAQVLIEQEPHLDSQQAAFAIGGIRQAGADIPFGQFGVLIKNLFMRHAFGEPAEDVADGDSHPPDARTPAALAGLDRNDLMVAHKLILLGTLA